MKNFAKILATGQSVRTTVGLQKILCYENLFVLRNTLARAKKQAILLNIAPGIWTLPHYSKFELANVVQTPSYISLETVLQHHGVIFQDYSHQISCIGLRTGQKQLENYSFTYSRIKPSLFYNPQGIIYKDNYAIATLERAFCDRLYLSPCYYVDNLSPLHREKLRQIAVLYENKRLILEIEQLYDAYHSKT